MSTTFGVNALHVPVPVASEGICSAASQAKLAELNAAIDAEIAAAKDPLAKCKIAWSAVSPMLGKLIELAGAVPTLSPVLPAAKSLKALADSWILRGGDAAPK